MIDCFNAELKIQDARLNATYRQAQADLNARQKASLTAAQRAWIAYRDADCAAQRPRLGNGLTDRRSSMRVAANRGAHTRPEVGNLIPGRKGGKIERLEERRFGLPPATRAQCERLTRAGVRQFRPTPARLRRWLRLSWT